MYQEKPVTYYFCHVDAKKEKKKIHKNAVVLTEMYSKAMDKLERQFTKELEKFVTKNQGTFINNGYAESVLFTFFDSYHRGSPNIVTTESPTVVELGFKFKSQPFVLDISNLLPGGVDPNSIEELTECLDNLNPKDFYIINSKHKKYTYKEFKKFLKKNTWE